MRSGHQRSSAICAFSKKTPIFCGIPALLLAFGWSQTAQSQPAVGQIIQGPDAKSCDPTQHQPSALVIVRGFKNAKGNIRLELYSDKPDEFLAKSDKDLGIQKIFRRFDVPLRSADDIILCMKVPTEGNYTMSVLHDTNANGKLDVWKDGFGFPNNPKLGMSKPKSTEALFTVDGTATPLEIVLNYVQGFSARPLKK